MKKVKFAVGDRVAETFKRYEGEYSDEPAKGTVVALGTNTSVMVKWDDDWKNRPALSNYGDPTDEVAPISVNISGLMSEKEADEKFSKLEAEYNKVADEIKLKLKVAAQAIRDSNKLAKKLGIDSLHDMYDVHDSLYRAMDSAGWNTSGFGC